MIPAERQALIISRLSGRGVLSIGELADLLDVSQMTIRRDIRMLEEQGRAVSVAGGVQLPERIFNEPSHLAKMSLSHDQKVAIGHEAAKLIAQDLVIYLDAGTTTLEIARNLIGRDDLTIVTNDFVVAGFIAQETTCRIFHTGGEIERENQSCVGTYAADTIRQFNFDIAFLSTSSFGPRGISTPAENKIAVKRAVVESAVKRVLVTDSSKYGRLASFNIFPLDMLSMIITDAELPETGAQTIKQRGVELQMVGLSSGGELGDTK